MITHLEPDWSVSEVKCALGSTSMNKASGGDGIPAVLNYDAVKVLHSVDLEYPVFIPIPKKGNTKEYSNYCTMHLFQMLTR